MKMKEKNIYLENELKRKAERDEEKGSEADGEVSEAKENRRRRGGRRQAERDAM